MSIPILQIVGYSNSGKTTLITEIIQELKDKNRKVAVIKSARMHEFSRDNNKDSSRFIAYGADNVAVMFENGVKMYMPTSMNIRKIIDIISISVDPDIILMEGFKKGTYDKILLWSDKLNENVTEFNLRNLKAIYNPNGTEIKNPLILKRIEKGIPIIETSKEICDFIEKKYF